MNDRMAAVEHGTDMSHLSSVDTIEALDALLDRLTSDSPDDAPWMANIVRRNGDSLTIGLGLPLLADSAGNRFESRPAVPVTVLSLVPASGDPPYYASRGDGSLAHNIVFFMGGQWSEFPSRQAIPIELARKGVREFVTSTELPTSVEWEKV